MKYPFLSYFLDAKDEFSIFVSLIVCRVANIEVVPSVTLYRVERKIVVAKSEGSKFHIGLVAITVAITPNPI